VPYVAIQTTIAKDEGLTIPCTLVPERVIRVIGCETLMIMYINAEKFTLRIRKIHFCTKEKIYSKNILIEERKIERRKNVCRDRKKERERERERERKSKRKFFCRKNETTTDRDPYVITGHRVKNPQHKITKKMLPFHFITVLH